MKLIKNSIFTFIIAAIIFGSIGVMAGNYNARQIIFTPNDFLSFYKSFS